MSQVPSPEPIRLRELLEALFLPEFGSGAAPHPAPLAAPAPPAASDATPQALDAPAEADHPLALEYPGMRWLASPLNLRGFALALGAFLLIAAGTALLNIQIAAFSGWLLLIGGLLLGFSAQRLWPEALSLLNELRPAPLPDGPARLLPLSGSTLTLARQGAAILGFALAVAAFLLSGGNRFSLPGLLALISGVGLLLFALGERPLAAIRADFQPLRPPNWALLGLLAAIMLAGGLFLSYQLDQAPANMTSDHVELSLDLARIRDGEPYIYFPGGGGREPLLPYLLALVQRLSGLPLSFTMMKAVGVAVAIAALPLVYLLAREISDERGALAAALLYALLLWPLTVSRLGLQHALIAPLALPLCIQLLRGLRSGERRAWLWAGFWAGLAAYGHESLRFAILLIPAAWLVAVAAPVYGLLRPGPARLRDEATLLRQSANALLSLALALALLMPLLRVWVELPQLYWGPFMQRNGGDLPGLGAALGGLWRALSLFHLRGDSGWFAAPPGPILDFLSGALLWAGAGLILQRLLLQRDSRDAFVLLALPLLMLPSGLALAVPAEIPSVIRAAGAAPLVAALAGLAISWLLALLRVSLPGVQGLALCLALALVMAFGVGQSSASRYFEAYRQQYDLSTWDHRGIAQSARAAAGPEGVIWVMGWPYWIDYRAVFIEDGREGRYNIDTASLAADLASGGLPEQRITFVLHPDDGESYALLASLFPEGDPQAEARPDGSQPYLLFTVQP